MRAVQLHGVRDLRFSADVDLPQSEKPLVKDCVLVRVEFCGLCGSDLGIYAHPTSTIIEKPNHYCTRVGPMIMGHEFSGIVESGSAHSY